MAHTNINPYDDSPPDRLNYTQYLGAQIASQNIHFAPNTYTPFQNGDVFGPFTSVPHGLMVQNNTVPDTDAGRANPITYSQALDTLKAKLAALRGQLPGAG